MASGDATPGLLSAASSGRPINVTATASVGTTIHTPSATGSDFELVTLYAWNNNNTTTRTLTIEFGGASYPVVMDLAPQRGVALVIDRFPITGANLITAYVDTGTDVFISGRVVTVEALT